MSTMRLRVRIASLPLMDSEGERSHEEVLKILKEATKKTIKRDEGEPVVDAEVIQENVENKGEVWKKKKQPAKKSKNPS